MRSRGLFQVKIHFLHLNANRDLYSEKFGEFDTSKRPLLNQF